MPITIDHVTICGSELKPLQEAFATAGLATDYGRPHANRITHMAILGFEDGSYLELIAPMRPGCADGSPWKKLMLENSGAGAWAAGTTDIRAEVVRLREHGIKVTDPAPGSRVRPDGKLLEWETASSGPGSSGAMLPFMIQDHTRRELRVQPTASVRGLGITGVATVVLGVNDLKTATALFRRAYDWPEPRVEQHADFAANIACFDETPVMLASPIHESSWLAPRSKIFGEIPAAFLLRTSEIDRVEKQFHLTGRSEWFGRQVVWFPPNKLCGARLGLIE